MNRQQLYTVLVVFVTMLAFSIGNVIYTNHVARQFCGVVTLIDDRYQKLPPAADPNARQFADAIHAYRLKLGC
jgi:hypothetical protein